jgi:hypothetical protein
MVKKCAFKISLICFFCAKDKDNRVRLSKKASGIDYCVLYITRSFMSKVELISKLI